MEGNPSQIEYIKVRKHEQDKKLLTDYQKLTKAEKMKLFWQISGIILISGILITLVIDLVVNNALSWSKYPVVVCSVIFINISLLRFLYNTIVFLLFGSFVSVSALLVLLDMFNGAIGWGVKLGVPLLFAAYIVFFVLILLIRLAKKHGLNIIAYCLLASGLLCICTEGIISLYRLNRFYIEWSLIVMASVLPVSVLLLYIHYRLKKGTNLKRFFHI